MQLMEDNMPCRDMIDRLLRTYPYHVAWRYIIATKWPRDAPIVVGDLTCTASRMFHIYDSEYQAGLYDDARTHQPRTATICWDHQRHQHTIPFLRDTCAAFQSADALLAAMALGMNRLLKTGVLNTVYGLDPDLLEATFECCPYNFLVMCRQDS